MKLLRYALYMLVGGLLVLAALYLAYLFMRLMFLALLLASAGVLAVLGIQRLRR